MLQYNKEYIINPNNIASILKDAKPEWEKRKKLYNRHRLWNKYLSYVPKIRFVLIVFSI